MWLRFFALVLPLAMLLPSSASGDSFSFRDGQVVVRIPVAWKVESGKGTVTFQSSDGLVAVNLAYAGADLDQAWSILTTEVDKVVTGVTVNKMPGKVGTFSGYVGTGRGMLGTTNVDCRLAAVRTPKGAVTVFALSVVGGAEKHRPAITELLDSLAPASVTAPGP